MLSPVTWALLKSLVYIYATDDQPRLHQRCVDTTVRREQQRLPVPTRSSVSPRDQTTPLGIVTTVSSWQQQVRADVIRSRDPASNSRYDIHDSCKGVLKTTERDKSEIKWSMWTEIKCLGSDVFNYFILLNNKLFH